MSRTQEAQNTLSLEVALNSILLEDCPTGSLLTKFLEEGYRGMPNQLSRLGFWKKLGFRYTKSFRPAQAKLKHLKDKIFLSKIAIRPQCNALIDPLKAHYGPESVLVSPENMDGINKSWPQELTYQLINSALKSINFSFAEIKMAFKEHRVAFSPYALKFHLFLQFVAYKKWQKAFRHYPPQIVVVDFDRDKYNNAIVLAARSCNIPSVTLVHGVLNPPYGYWPIIANQIWCWSSYQQQQLISQGVLEQHIKIVGSPIVQKFTKNEVSAKESLRIGIGINPISSEENEALINHITSHSLAQQFQFLVKLHPSMQKEDWMVALESPGISFFTHAELSLESLLAQIDLLVIGNSGLGFEAIMNNTPIWVYMVDPGSEANDKIMIEKASCPDITSALALGNAMQELLDNPHYPSQLLKLERSFVKDHFYKAIGRQATANIIAQINNQLQHAV